MLCTVSNDSPLSRPWKIENLQPIQEHSRTSESHELPMRQNTCLEFLFLLQDNVSADAWPNESETKEQKDHHHKLHILTTKLIIKVRRIRKALKPHVNVHQCWFYRRAAQFRHDAQVNCPLYCEKSFVVVAWTHNEMSTWAGVLWDVDRACGF